MKRLLLVGLLAATARAVDVSGIYEDAGTVVGAVPGTPEATVPFRGLAALEFDLPLARQLHAGSTRVQISQRSNAFVIRCLDNDGTETWSGRWERGVGYEIEGETVKLIFRAQRFGTDGFMFLLSPVNNQNLLLVEVHRVKSTSFGPGMKPVGTFLFSRPEPRRVAAR